MQKKCSSGLRWILSSSIKAAEAKCHGCSVSKGANRVHVMLNSLKNKVKKAAGAKNKSSPQRQTVSHAAATKTQWMDRH